MLGEYNSLRIKTSVTRARQEFTYLLFDVLRTTRNYKQTNLEDVSFRKSGMVTGASPHGPGKAFTFLRKSLGHSG